MKNGWELVWVWQRHAGRWDLELRTGTNGCVLEIVYGDGRSNSEWDGTGWVEVA